MLLSDIIMIVYTYILSVNYLSISGLFSLSTITGICDLHKLEPVTIDILAEQSVRNYHVQREISKLMLIQEVIIYRWYVYM